MKCRYCKSEVSVLDKECICPACGNQFVFDNIEDLAQYVVSLKGFSIISEHSMFLSTLRDYAPNLSDDIKLVQIAIEAGVYDDLVKSNNKDDNYKKGQIKKSVEKLKTSCFLEESQAIRSIKIIISCMGWRPTLLNGLPLSLDGSSINQKDSFIRKHFFPFIRTTSNIARIIAVCIVGLFITLFVMVIRSCSNDSSNINMAHFSEKERSGYYDDSSNSLYGVNVNSEAESEASSDNYTSLLTGETNSNDSDTRNDTQKRTDNKTDTNTTSVQTKPIKNKISGNIIAGTLNNEDDIVYYSFTPVNTGLHRFDFDISNVNANYYFEIKTKKEQSLGEYCYSSGGHGGTYSLVAGEDYTIVVSYKYLPCDYDIKIGIPDQIKTLSGTSINGALDFKDKENIIEYTAPKTGRYRFTITVNDVNADFNITVHSSKKAKLIDVNYHGTKSALGKPGITMDLKEGEKYTISVAQEYLLCEYTILVDVPKDIVSVAGSVISGSFAFIDQQDIYTYIAPKTGEYIFTLKSSDSNSSYDLDILNSKNSVLRSVSKGISSTQTSVKLVSGESYKFQVDQDYRLCDYTIIITLP